MLCVQFQAAQPRVNPVIFHNLMSPVALQKVIPATQETSIPQRREMIRLVEEGHSYASAAKQMGIGIWAITVPDNDGGSTNDQSIREY